MSIKKGWFVALVFMLGPGCGIFSSSDSEEIRILALAFNRNGVQGVDSDGRAYVFDPKNLKEMRENHQKNIPTKDITAIAFSPEGGFLAVADRLDVVRVGQVNGTMEKLIHAPSYVTGVAVSPLGLSVAVLTTDDVITIYQKNKNDIMIQGGRDHLSPAMAFSPDGKTLAVGLLNLDNPNSPMIRIHNTEDGSLMKSCGPAGVATAVTYSPDGKSLAVAGSPGNSTADPTLVAILNIQDGLKLAEWKETKPGCAIRSLCWSGPLLVCAPFHGGLRTFKLDDGKLFPL